MNITAKTKVTAKRSDKPKREKTLSKYPIAPKVKLRLKAVFPMNKIAKIPSVVFLLKQGLKYARAITLRGAPKKVEIGIKKPKKKRTS